MTVAPSRDSLWQQSDVWSGGDAGKVGGKVRRASVGGGAAYRFRGGNLS